MCILSNIIFPSFDLSSVFVKGAFIFGCVCVGALEPVSFRVYDANN